MTTYDLIIIGAGAMGSAVAYHAAKAGHRVLVLEQFEIDHQKGSSYGYSRIIRYAYTQPYYVEMAKTVFPMWAALEEEAGEKLYTKTGGIDFGTREDASLMATIASLAQSGIAHEILTPDEAMRRHPQFRFNDDEGDFVILSQADTGALAASNCVKAHIRLAQQYGADVKDHTAVTGITVKSDSVDVQTDNGAFSGAKLVITAGAWAKGMLADLGLNLPLTGLQAQEIYFEPAANPDDYLAENMPAFIYHQGFDSGEGIYGIPRVGGSWVKVGVHGGDAFEHPSEVDYARQDHKQIETARAFSRRFIPALGDGRLVSARICFYTATPDEDFIIDRHPEYPHVVIGSPCSGHGFKFSTLIGKILSDLAFDGASSHDLSHFSVTRFA